MLARLKSWKPRFWRYCKVGCGSKNVANVRGVIDVPDVTFATLVYDDEVTVMMQQGIILLRSNTTGKPYLLPKNVVLPAEAVGAVVTVPIRNITNEVLDDVGDDDIYEQQLEYKEDIVPIDNWDEVMTLLDDTKLKRVSKVAGAIANIISGLALAADSTIFQRNNLIEPAWLLIIGQVVGLLICMGLGVPTTVSAISSMNSHVLRDRCGNYIDVETGRTSLNGGMKIPIKS